ncbi:hypothetical protein [Mammaliicoccus sp. A-M4]|uniref:hypothetical protein n=1 Tax=Mammaliicoccus sp. A-M4 TaxID=2898664 RepID=UPI001EFA3C31|nr:hypothetical protein [Mammaliicoccus sp. A-M4]
MENKITMTIDSQINIKNRNELDELLAAMQENVTELNANLDKLENFKFDISFEQVNKEEK